MAAPVKIVGHQYADAAGFDDILPHLGEAFRGRLEVRGDDVAALQAVLDDLQIPDIGGEDRGHLRPVDAGQVEGVVRGALQRLEEGPG